MPYPLVETPIPGAKAFERFDDAAILSQAAILLSLGAQLRGDESLLSAGPADLAALKLPLLSPALGRLDARRIRGGLETRYAMRPQALRPGEADPALMAKIVPDLADRFFGQPSPLAAAELMEVSLNHPHELIRVSAATAYSDRTSEPDRLLAILRIGTRSTDDLTRSVAATALAQIAPESKELDDLVRRKGGNKATGAASHTTVLVHGTWALNSPWWQPGGNFHTYLTQTLPPLPRTPPLPTAPPWSAPYAAGDYYSWSGGYSDAARALAATDLVKWANTHSAPDADFITHSHGGNVAMLATQPGMAMTAKEMVLLSCPVHFPKYAPDFSKVQKIVSVRVHLDLVILADRGGQRFNDPRFSENVLRVWFDHFATHDPAVWNKYSVPAML
jgi:hypothetical protein